MRHSSCYLLRIPVLCACLVTLFLGCTGAGRSEEADAQPLTEAERQEIFAYYESKPDFFTFASPEALPNDLEWENGEGLAPFASPNAIKGGTITSYIPTWPPTIRFVGPDSNHSLRSILLDENKMSLVDLHPIEKKWHSSLATSWAVSADKRTVYFRLDPDAHYSDGMPVKADDYLYTFYFMQSPHIQAPWYNNWYGQRYTNITKYDDYTISLTLPEAKPDPIYFTGISPTPSHFYRVLGADFVQKYQWKFEPTTGPWELLERNVRQGNYMIVTRVKDWWAQDKKFFKNRYNVDRRRFNLIRDMNIAFESFKDGRVDMFGLTLPEYWHDRTEHLEAVKKGWIHKATFYNEVPRATIGLYLNTGDPLLANRDVREGIHFATNWQQVIDRHFRGDFARLQGEVDGYGEFDNGDLTPRPFDPAKAREAFARAGFDRAGPDGILINDRGQRLSFTITIAQGPRADEAAILKEQARRAGLDYTLEVLDPTANYKKVMDKKHQIAFMGWGVGGLYPRFWEGYHSINAYNEDGTIKTQTNNVTLTANPDIDVLIEQYDRSTNLEEMVVLAHRLQELLWEEASFVPGYKTPFYRVGYWSWVRFPEHFDVPLSEGPSQYGLYWIDPQIKKDVEEARKAGTDLGETIRVFGKKLNTGGEPR